MFLKKSDFKETQEFDQKLMYLEDSEVLRCFNHFKDRYKERTGKEMTYINYWENYIYYLRGYCINIYDKYMYRIIGNYQKDEYLFNVVYVKIHLDIYVPLTIIKIEDSKQKIRLYRKILEIKKKK
ncbi:hypothetical protein M0Q97_10875 [Candidatus Dojkabacteria bacterium]|jgi:hypothetical protein|nr:hypothetical protein [Candidatus Dojkabacteria bacterium]